MFLKVDRNPIGIIEFGIDPIEGKIILPYQGELIEDYGGIETYKFNKPLLRCNSLRITSPNSGRIKLLNQILREDSNNYVVYSRINDEDIPYLLITITDDNTASLYRIDSNGNIQELADNSRKVKKFYDQFSEETIDFNIPSNLENYEYRILMGVIQLSLIKDRIAKNSMDVIYSADFTKNFRYYILKRHCITTFDVYKKVKILGQIFMPIETSDKYCEPDKEYLNGNLHAFIGDNNLFFILDWDKYSEVLDRICRKFNVDKCEINKKINGRYSCTYHCEHDYEVLRNPRRIYKKILRKLRDDILHYVDKLINEKKIEEFVRENKDIEVTLEDSISAGNCPFGTRQFAEKYGFSEEKLPTVKELFEIMKKDYAYSDGIRRVLAYLMKKKLDENIEENCVNY